MGQAQQESRIVSAEVEWTTNCISDKPKAALAGQSRSSTSHIPNPTHVQENRWLGPVSASAAPRFQRTDMVLKPHLNRQTTAWRVVSISL